MIYVSESELRQVEYLLQQSAQGNHVLFDAESLREALTRMPLLSPDESYGVEHHIERLISQPGLAGKRAYLEGLDRDTYLRVVRTYLNIVENNLFETGEVRH